jgi:ribosomal protein S18 acetylase RimI-like enzyme
LNLPPIIRPASRRDAADLAILVDIAGQGLPSHFWRELAEPGQSVFEVGRARALRDEGSFSWRNAHIAEVDGAAAGALVGYVIDDPVDLAGINQMSPTVRALSELEAEAPGHWYVNVLATYPEYRGKGIGTALLSHADAIGRSDAPNGMAIIVASENRGAVRLYQRCGYQPAAKRNATVIPGLAPVGDWLLLTKPHR